MKNLNNFFKPRTIAVIGASREKNKVGNVILTNIIGAGFKGNVIPINPKAKEILGKKTYSSILKVKKRIDLAIIAVPQPLVMKIVKQCKTKKIKDILIVTAGYSEIGNKKDEERLEKYIKENKLNVIGPNCLGIFDTHNKLDTLFLPEEKMMRPKKGPIGFICQSGAVGSAILDLIADKNHGFSKFISYGNSIDVDESDLLEYLNKDKNTKVICIYLEGIDDGEKFFRICKKIKKPIIILKGGLTKEGAKATLSHTGTLAGKKEVYYGVFNQLNLITVDSLEAMFDIASIFEKGIKVKKNRVLIITNGGGYGIISTDDIADSKNLKMASMSLHTQKVLRKKLARTVNIKNPLDLVGDATPKRYDVSLEQVMLDRNVDIILLEVLYQTPLLTKNIINVVAKYKNKKPMIIASTGSKKIREFLTPMEELGYVTFNFPRNAVDALDKVVGYNIRK